MGSEYVNTQDLSSDRIHKRYPTEAGYATHEADNLDDAGPYRVLTEDEFVRITQRPGSRERYLCKRCYPSDDDGAMGVVAAPAPSGGSGEDDASTPTVYDHGEIP